MSTSSIESTISTGAIESTSTTPTPTPTPSNIVYTSNSNIITSESGITSGGVFTTNLDEGDKKLTTFAESDGQTFAIANPTVSGTSKHSASIITAVLGLLFAAAAVGVIRQLH